MPPDNIRIPPYVTLISLKLSKLNDPNLLNLLYDVMTKEAPEDILSRFKGKVTLPLFRAIFKIGESDLYSCKEIKEIGTLPYGLLIGTKITKQEYLNEVNNANKIKDFNESITYEDLSLIKGLDSSSEAKNFLLRLKRHTDSLIGALEALIEPPDDLSICGVEAIRMVAMQAAIYVKQAVA